MLTACLGKIDLKSLRQYHQPQALTGVLCERFQIAWPRRRRSDRPAAGMVLLVCISAFSPIIAVGLYLFTAVK